MRVETSQLRGSTGLEDTIGRGTRWRLMSGETGPEGVLELSLESPLTLVVKKKERALARCLGWLERHPGH